MKFSLIVMLTGLSACGWLWSAEALPTVGATLPPSEQNVAELIQGLGDERFQAREAAMKELWEIGEAALPMLSVAVEDEDPEKAFRAAELVQKIQLSITPETDPVILSMIERYAKASTNTKLALLDQLARKRAWRQILKLYSTEKSPELRARFQDAAKESAVRAARECVMAGDPGAAKNFLEMAPADASGLMALADFHRSQGTLTEEIKRAQALKGRNSDAWQLALQRAGGNLEAARDLATAADETRIAASMSLLLGDPIPWLKSGQNGGEENAIAKAYTSLAIRRWNGKEIRASELDFLVRAMGNQNAEDAQNALRALLLLGQMKLGEEGLAKAQPFVSFGYLESLERVPEALKSLNLDVEKPDFKTWVGKRITHLTADIEDQHGPSSDVEQLVGMANFMERRGFEKEADEAYLQPLLDLAKKDEGIFTDFLKSLFGNQEGTSGAPRLATRVGMAWAGQNQAQWQGVVAAALGEEDEVAEWWEWLAELDPSASRSERFNGLLALFDIGDDSEKLRSKWGGLAWDALQKAPDDIKGEMARLISFVSIQLRGNSGNVELSLRVWDKLSPTAQNQIFWGRHIEDLSAGGRWGEIVEIFLKQIDRTTELKQEVRPDFYAYVAGVLRKAGRAAEAVKYDTLADQLALGDVDTAIKIGHAYAFSCDYQRAELWWTRAIRSADPDSQEFVSYLPLITDFLVERGEWQESAAIFEALGQIYGTLDVIAFKPLLLVRQRMQADMARALANLKNDREGSIAVLEKCHQMAPTEGGLADDFFPSLRKAGLIELHNRLFEISWQEILGAAEKYPRSHNTWNTAGWLAARARIKLPEAESFLKKALSMSPEQSAYLDTMAEIQFAKGNRKKAIEWSTMAVNFDPQDRMLRRQHERFRSAPLPK